MTGELSRSGRVITVVMSVAPRRRLKPLASWNWSPTASPSTSSATHLVAFLACEHLTELERAALAGLTKRPMREDPELDVIRRRGYQHEGPRCGQLQDEGRMAVTHRSRRVLGRSWRRPPVLLPEQTIQAMAAGVDVVYQATFFEINSFRGHADFLLRGGNPRTGRPAGDPALRVADTTKLARHVKASAVLQICSRRGPASVHLVRCRQKQLGQTCSRDSRRPSSR